MPYVLHFYTQSIPKISGMLQPTGIIALAVSLLMFVI